MNIRPSLLVMLAGAATFSVLANGVSAAGASGEQTRLGAAISDDLSARDREAAKRNRALDLREQAMQATEQRIGSKLEQVAPPAKKAELPARAEEEDQYAELAKIYQAMKPNRAAPVFEQLAMDVQVKVAKEMRERSVASIMANMSPKAAAALTMAMAKRALPLSMISRPDAPPRPAPQVAASR
jgi:flagellar motility protein MotE (MotC chaperone)